MGRNRTQRYADHIITDAKTLQADEDGSAEELLQEAKNREADEAKSAAVNSIEAKAEELSMDIPMSKEEFLEFCVKRYNRAMSEVREGGYKE